LQENSPQFLSFKQLRSQMLDHLYLGVGIAAIPSLALSLFRIPIIGMQNFMLVQIILVTIIFLVWALKRNISYNSRVAILLSILWVATFAAMSKVGPVSDSKIFMVIFSFTAIMFLDSKQAWSCIAIILISMIIFSYLAVTGYFHFEVNFQNYATHPVSWILTTWNMGVFSVVTGYLGWRMIGAIISQSTLAKQLYQKQEKIASRIPGMVYQYRLLPDGTSCFPYASEGIRKIFNMEPEDVSRNADPILDTIHPDDLNEFKHSIMTSAKEMQPWQMEFRILNKDERIRWLSGSSSPEQEEDGSIFWHGIITDITDKKQADIIKEEFVSSVSHELRTPLTSIIGILRLVNSGAVDYTSKKYKNLIGIAEKNSNKLLFLINDLLDIEKLERGQFKLALKSVAIKELLESVIEQNQSYALEHGTKIILTDCQESTFTGDNERLQQVFTNLISNACKYSPKDQPVEISCRNKNNGLEVKVRDHGEGIPPEFIPSLFDRFTQADSNTARQVGGTGLGLSIVKKIVELHHGEVNLINVDGSGACFSVFLPLEQSIALSDNPSH
jgi:PAS domain S-box-containing protein